MATIYRFIIEQKSTGGRGGRKEGSTSSKKTTAKKGKMVSIFGGEKGGVEHNRKLRAINPLLNRVTGGYWEKGTRLGRAGLGLVQRNTVTGAIGLSPVAIAIIISFVIQTVLKIQSKEMAIANMKNERNYKMMENGVGTIHGQYNVSVSAWDGRITYNENK